MKTLVLKPEDATWLLLETVDTPMHVGVLAIFRKLTQRRAGLPAQAGRADARFQVSEPWNMRLSGDGVTGLVPRLVAGARRGTELPLPARGPAGARR